MVVEFLSPIFKTCPIMEHRSLNMSLQFFLNLIEVHIVQLEITFGKHVEIPLNDRK
jgi:hypothetical protein